VPQGPGQVLLGPAFGDLHEFLRHDEHSSEHEGVRHCGGDHAAPMRVEGRSSISAILEDLCIRREMVDQQGLEDDPQRLHRSLPILGGHSDLSGDERLTEDGSPPVPSPQDPRTRLTRLPCRESARSIRAMSDPPHHTGDRLDVIAADTPRRANTTARRPDTITTVAEPATEQPPATDRTPLTSGTSIATPSTLIGPNGTAPGMNFVEQQQRVLNDAQPGRAAGAPLAIAALALLVIFTVILLRAAPRTPKRPEAKRRLSSALAQQRQQAQDLQVQPDDGDSDAVRAVPLHVLGSSVGRPLSMKLKSSARLSAATMTTTMLMPMPSGLGSFQ